MEGSFPDTAFSMKFLLLVANSSMSQEHQKLLDHWHHVIGARCGNLVIRLSSGSEELHDVQIIPGPFVQREQWEYECHVVNDWEPVLITALWKGILVGGYIVARFPAPVHHVVETEGSTSLRLVEETEARLPMHRMNEELAECLSVETKIAFTVTDLCPYAICERCERGAQRCKCTANDRWEFLGKRARSTLADTLREMSRIAAGSTLQVPRLTLSPVNKGVLVEPEALVQFADEFEDISSCAIDHSKKQKTSLQCQCSVQ
jgi:hypothetical protein